MNIPANFPLLWRFTDSGYNVLPASVLEKIEPLPVQTCEALWRTWVSPEGDHLAQITEMKGTVLSTFEGHWDEPELARAQLRKLDLSDNKVSVLWGAQLGLSLDWHVFVRYWDDFFYPSDDNNVLIHSAEQLVIAYIEDRFIVRCQAQLQHELAR
jgi:hypothetical protein